MASRKKKNVRHDIPAEMSFLGCLFFGSDDLALGLTLLQPEDFYRSSHAMLFRAIGELSQKGVKLDEITLSDHLQSTGRLDDVHVKPAQDVTQMKAVRAYLYQLIHATSGPAMMDSYASIIRERARTRKIIEAADAAVSSAESGLPPAEVAATLEDAISKSSGREKTRISASELMHGLADDIESGKVQEAYPSGFQRFDEEYDGGLHPGLTIVAGPSGSGKTTLLLQWGIRAALSGHEGLWMMEDMNRKKLRVYMACAHLGVSECDLRDPAKLERSLGACAELAGLPYELYDGSLDFSAIISTIRAESTRGVRWFLLDSLQSISVKKSERKYEEAEAVTDALQHLGVRLNIYIIATSRMLSLGERNMRANISRRWPTAADAQSGGRTIYGADEFLILWPPKENGTLGDGYQGAPEHWLIVDKSRAGSNPNKLLVEFQGAWHRFCLK